MIHARVEIACVVINVKRLTRLALRIVQRVDDFAIAVTVSAM